MKLIPKRILLPLVFLSFLPVAPVFADGHMENWVKAARKEFASKQRYPRSAIDDGIEGTVTVAVRVNADGSITGFDIRKSSNHTILDDQVLSLLTRVDPLPALPGEAMSHEFVIPLSYRMQKGAEVNAEVKVESNRDTMKNWAKAVMRRVARKQAYPSHLLDQGIEGITKVELTIAANGAITAQEVVESSGHAQLDQETLELVARINPLPPLPEDKSEFVVTIPVKYKVSR